MKKLLYIPYTLIVIGLVLAACHSKMETGKVPERDNGFIGGADLSYVNQVEDHGGRYFQAGRQVDPFSLFSSAGFNTVRVRLWHNPVWTTALTDGKQYGDLTDVTRTIRRAKSAGMKVNLDLHYSDNWADPHKQSTPAAWKDLPADLLGDSVYRYTRRVLETLHAQGLAPEMIQVGNETNDGMLFPTGKVSLHGWKPFAALLSAGIRAVRDFSSANATNTSIIIHVAQLQDAGYWLQQLQQHDVSDYDIIGLSHYSKWSEVNTWPAFIDTISMLRQKYGKKVMIVETAYPWTGGNADAYPNVINGADTVPGYPATVDGQAAYLGDLVAAIRKGGGSGLMYWEPAWITSRLRDQWGQGSSWDNCTLFDSKGNALPVLSQASPLFIP